MIIAHCIKWTVASRTRNYSTIWMENITHVTKQGGLYRSALPFFDSRQKLSKRPAVIPSVKRFFYIAMSGVIIRGYVFCSSKSKLRYRNLFRYWTYIFLAIQSLFKVGFGFFDDGWVFNGFQCRYSHDLRTINHTFYADRMPRT